MGRRVRSELPGFRPCATGGFGCRGGDGSCCRVAECQQHALRSGFAADFHFPERSAEGFDAKVVLTFRALHAVEERRDFDEPVSGVEEIQIENLLSVHTFRWRNYSVQPVASNPKVGLTHIER